MCMQENAITVQVFNGAWLSFESDPGDVIETKYPSVPYIRKYSFGLGFVDFIQMLNLVYPRAEYLNFKMFQYLHAAL